MNRIHPIERKEKDKDLTRIFQLYEIIKRYELLVEFLLADNQPVDFTSFNMKEYLDSVERKVLMQAFEEAKGNMVQMERITNRSRHTIYKKLVEFGVKIKTESLKPDYEPH